MRRKLTALTVTLTITLFLPVALFGLMASVNEYREQGIGGAVDCNGPATVMLFVAPSLVVYGAAAAYYATLLRRAGRRLPAAALMVLCLGMALASGGKAWAAYREKSRPEHRETCGAGW